MKPPLKYVGGKGKLLAEIKRYIPEDTTVIVEPFSGSAALSFSKDLPFYLVDKSPELVNFLQVLNNKDAYTKMIGLLRTFEDKHSKEFYLETRAADREPRFNYKPKVHRAARYYYIIYAGFNGLYRVNKSNQSNTPWGQRDFVVNRGRLLDCHDHMIKYCKGVHYQEFNEIVVYQQLLDLGEKPFVFIDPPYYNAFTSYTPKGDGGDFYYNLYNFLCDLDDLGITFLMTNSDNDYINEMFSEWDIDRITTKYSVAASGERRGERFESFISNKGKIT